MVEMGKKCMPKGIKTFSNLISMRTVRNPSPGSRPKCSQRCKALQLRSEVLELKVVGTAG